MSLTARDLFVNAFRRQTVARAAHADRTVNASGLVGVLRDGGRRVSLLVLDDSGVGELGSWLSGHAAGTVLVMDTAPLAVATLASGRGWTVSQPEAMVCRDLSTVPQLSLERSLRREELPLHPDGRTSGPDLLAAAELAVASDPRPDFTAAELAGHLRTMTPTPRLFAATDAGGGICATAGCRVSGQDAAVFFVNTAAVHRRRGIGAAMTAAVLRTAHEMGATGATLDASAAGASIYRRLGFESAGAVTKFSRTGQLP